MSRTVIHHVDYVFSQVIYDLKKFLKNKFLLFSCTLKAYRHIDLSVFLILSFCTYHNVTTLLEDSEQTMQHFQTKIKGELSTCNWILYNYLSRNASTQHI